MRIAEMKINNKLIDEAKLNGEIVYRLDRDRTPPEILYVKIQLYYPLIYPSDSLYPSGNLFPRIERNPNYAKIGDTIYIEFQVSEQLQGNPIITIGTKQFTSNLKDMSNNIYDAYITLTEDMNLDNWQKIQITISNLVDIIGNIGNDVITTGDENHYVILSVDIPYNLKNIIYNSDFRFGTNGFKNYDNAKILNIQENALIFTKIIIDDEQQCYITCTLNEELKLNHFYYLKAKYALKTASLPVLALNTVLGTEDEIKNISRLNYGIDNYNLCTDIIKISNSNNLVFGVNGYWNPSGVSNVSFSVKEMMCVDVTELINSGMTETEIKTLLDNTYFPDLN